MKVIVVDDEPIIRMDLKEILKELGYEVVGEASAVKEMLSLIDDVVPDVVLMDINLSDGNALTVAKDVAKKAALVVITAYANKEFIEMAKDAGVVGYLVKPFGKEDVYTAVEIAVHSYRKLRVTEERLENRKLIERAKGIIMQKLSISESKAYRYLQKLSMDSGKSMKSIAEEIIGRYG